MIYIGEPKILVILIHTKSLYLGVKTARQSCPASFYCPPGLALPVDLLLNPDGDFQMCNPNLQFSRLSNLVVSK